MRNKLLIVDDDPGVCKVIRKALAGMDLEILEVSDGDQALKLVERERPSLVLIDIHMPRLDGISALEEIRGVDPGIAVVVMSGDAGAGRVDLAKERGASGFMPKPLDLEFLRGMVRKFIR